jgi:acetyl-CoA carboxylase biotin carboxyl carrier protein
MATSGKKKSAGKLTRMKNALGKKAPKKAKKNDNSTGRNAQTDKEARNAAAGESGAKAVAKNGRGSSGDMDLEFLRGLIEAVDQSGIDSVEIDREGTKVRISKTPPAAPITALQAMPAMSAPMMHAPVQQAPAVTATGGGAAAAAPPAAPEAPKSNYSDIKSPMVGTFYRAPAPEAPSYVEIGSHVTKGQTLCILEAMKLMNELESEVDGIVREILVDNADPVEYGQVLFRIEPASR